jgi:hypothetical protein
MEILMAKPLKLQIVQTAKELIQDEQHWCRGYLAVDDYASRSIQLARMPSNAALSLPS